MLRWDHQLAQDPVPTIDAITVEPTQVSVPLLSLLLLAVTIILGMAALRGWRPMVALVSMRVLFAGASSWAPGRPSLSHCRSRYGSSQRQNRHDVS